MNGSYSELKAMGLKALLDVKGKILLQFIGSSMKPTIPYNSEIVVSKFSCLTLGRIYVFYYVFPTGFSQLVCHRLIEIKNNKCFLQGDNRQYKEVVKKDAIIGEVLKWS